MRPAGRQSATAVLWGSIVTVCLTAILLGRSVGEGHLLYRDFIAVPDPAFSARTWGLDAVAPRAVPLDAVTTSIAMVVPTWLQQQVMLVCTLLLAGLGMTVLLRRRGAPATMTGAAIATWSPYAGERLLLGQPPTLLAWSMMPWLVLAVRARGSRARWLTLIALAAAPAALTPFGGTIAAVLVLGVALLERGRQRSGRDLAALTLLAVAWCLPWLIPAMSGRVEAGQAGGARAFAIELSGPLDVVNVLGGGGVWAAGARLASRGGVALLATAAVLALSVLGIGQLRGSHRVALACMLLLPPALAMVLTVDGVNHAWANLQSVPGVGLFRDTHRLLGLSWFAAAILSGIGMSHLVERATIGGGLAAAGLTAAGVALAPLSAPELPSRLAAAYDPVAYPPSFADVVETVGRDPVLILPWNPQRQVVWAGAYPFLDPLPLALPGRVLASHDLVVQRDGQRIPVGNSDPRQAAGWTKGRIDPDELERLGITRIVMWKGTPPGVDPTVTRGSWIRLLDTAEFAVWAVAASHDSRK